MSQAIDNLKSAMQKALAIRPKVGGFPYLAEVLRAAGVSKNVWSLPSCQSLYLTTHGPVVMQGSPLVLGSAEVPTFNRDALIAAIRTDQAGNSTFPEFLVAAWQAGVVRYEVDFNQRHVVYYGCNDEAYLEEYPAATIE